MPAPRVERRTWRNGVRVALDVRPAASVAIAVRVEGGAWEEDPTGAGHTHLLEHLLVRAAQAGAPAGTLPIAAETARDHLVLCARAPAAHAPALAGALVHALSRAPGPFAADDLAPQWRTLMAERAFMAHDGGLDALLRLAWPDHPLGRPLDTGADRLPAPAALAAWQARLCVGSRVNAAAVGGFDARAMRAALAPLGSLPPGTPPQRGAPPRFVPGHYAGTDPAGGAALWWGLPCTPFAPALHGAWTRTAATLQHVVTAAVREPGLAYACAVWPELYAAGGLIVIRVAAPPGHVAACQAAVASVLEALWADALPARAWTHAAGQLRAQALCARDDLDARAVALAAPATEAHAACAPGATSDSRPSAVIGRQRAATRCLPPAGQVLHLCLPVA